MVNINLQFLFRRHGSTNSTITNTTHQTVKVLRTTLCYQYNKSLPILLYCLEVGFTSYLAVIIHLRGLITHCVRRGPWNPRGKGGDLEGRTLANLPTVSPMLPPGEYKRGVAWTCDSDSAFCQIPLVLLLLLLSLWLLLQSGERRCSV